MNIKATYEALQTVANTVLPTFTFYGMLKSRYNSVKQIADNTIIVEPPRQWPANARNTCESRFTAKVWLLIRQSIKPATGGTMQYPPFDEIDIRDTLMTAALTFINGINQHSNLQVLSDLNGDGDLVTLTDAAEGGTTNIEAMAYFTINLASYGSSGSFVPAVFAPGLAFVTKYTIENGDDLPTGLTPDILYINTGLITDDIETDPLAIDVPTGYVYVSIETAIETGNPVTGITYAEGELTATGNEAPGFTAVLKFERSQL